MALSSEYLDYVLGQLGGLSRVSSRRMFGGAGLYCDELFFGLVFGDTLYLRVDDRNRADYASRGMTRFRPYPNRPLLSMTYYEVPAEVLEDADQLAIWARRSLDAALAASKPAKAVRPAKAARSIKRRRLAARKAARGR